MKVSRFLCVVFLVHICGTSYALADPTNLPVRETPIPRTTSGVPHIQIDVEPVPALSEALLEKVSELPGVEIRQTVVSLPGALGFWITEDTALARPEVIVGGREFAHLHPDGSLHASLSPTLAKKAAEKGWAVSHPWADQRPGWGGFVMIFTPKNTDELDVVFELVEASYEFVTGLRASSD
ncbi:hypothetical protein RUE5091_02602 [Ruegeria denitrificans]|uniref:Luciferase domain-containing protein n=1 Tax=Ruegeria denitrificans TaxID=1715692 RepID=A0A0P1IBY7_9RHOB|nr:luciferase family protein [Ruegeria denitrificans]CUK04226.1 hypothetical protein RUE5091_02602 [Ruegeria denitrificans]